MFEEKWSENRKVTMAAEFPLANFSWNALETIKSSSMATQLNPRDCTGRPAKRQSFGNRSATVRQPFGSKHTITQFAQFTARTRSAFFLDHPDKLPLELCALVSLARFSNSRTVGFASREFASTESAATLCVEVANARRSLKLWRRLNQDRTCVLWRVPFEFRPSAPRENKS